MRKKKTAVDWLLEQLKNQGYLYDLDIEAAKAMEKEQIKDAFINYFYNEYLPLNDKRALHKIAEDYYNKTYGTPQ